MSIMNDYSVKIMAEQRQRDFQAEAASERLARVAAGERQVWWRRLRRTFAPVATTSAATVPAVVQHEHQPVDPAQQAPELVGSGRSL